MRLIAYFGFLKFVMKKINLSVILILIGFSAVGQSDYLVTLRSDTIKGDVRIMSYDQLDRVQISTNGKKQTLSALDVLIVSMDNEFYKAVKLDNAIRLMRVIRSGYLNLYAFKLPNQTGFDGRYLLKLDGTSMEVPNLGFKKIMANYLSDCTELSENLKTGDMGKQDLIEITDLYNECISKAKPPVQQETISTAELENKTTQMAAIQTLMDKIKEQDFSTKADALDILADIQSKITKNENVSNYLIGGLQSALKDQSALSEDLDKVVALIKK